MRALLRVAAITGAAVVFAGAGAPAPTAESALVGRCVTAFRRALNAPTTAIPVGVMRAARAIAVFPSDPQRISERRARGIVSARAPEPDKWLLPAIVTYDATFRIPARTAIGDVAVVALSKRGFDYLAHDFALPEGIEIPPGPLGPDTPSDLHLDLVAYGRLGRGFVGLAVEGLRVEEDAAATERFYGAPASLHDLMFGVVRRGPRAASDWRLLLESYFTELRARG